MRLDGLRAPTALDPHAALYKDWLHLNVFDADSGLVGLVNVCVHGPPDDERARVVGTALVHLPRAGWVGNSEGAGLADVAVAEHHVGLRAVGVGLDPAHGRVLASARLPADGLELNVSARATASGLWAPWRLPLGGGWISWAAVSHLRARGTASVLGAPIDLDGADAYHDHNWGRWQWGDDLGWLWGCFVAPGGDPVFVVTCTTDREHVRRHRPLLFVQAGGRRRAFTGAAVRIEESGTLDAAPRRLPGALAALHTDRARPRLPAEVRIDADDGRAHVRIAFRPRAAAQLITVEPMRPGFGFIHELPGSFVSSGQANGRDLGAQGLGIFEHVD
jgi:hypothetical protein